jgi:hypothetical protein
MMLLLLCQAPAARVKMKNYSLRKFVTSGRNSRVERSSSAAYLREPPRFLRPRRFLAR